MPNFIAQISKEHHLLDELVTNALEAADTRVEISHFGDRLVINNDGTPLSKKKIKEKLLTAFEPGEEKSLETNRGLGFIALYEAMANATIRTGTQRVDIKSWDDIVISSSQEYENGVEVDISLNKAGQDKYSSSHIKERLNYFVYWGDITIYFGTGKGFTRVGRKLENPLNLHNHKKYKYANLRYSTKNLFDSSLVFLLKLTNVEAYRRLPVTMSIDDILDERYIDHLILGISHGAYLDSTRRSLTSWGKQQVENLIKLVNHDAMIENLQRGLFNLKQEALGEIKKRLITIKKNSKLITHETIEQFIETLEFVNARKIVRELSYVDLFFHLFEFSQHKLQVDPVLPVVFSRHSNFADQEKFEPSSTEFHRWISSHFPVSLPDLFGTSQIGFFYEYGEITGQATLRDLINLEQWIEFDRKIFSNPAVENISKIIVVLHDKVEYLAKINEKKTTISSLTKQQGYTLGTELDVSKYALSPNKQTNEFTVDGDITFDVIKQNNQNIPCLIWPNAKEVYESHLNDDLDSKYLRWRETCRMIITSYGKKVDDLLQQVVPVIVFRSTDDNSLACKINSFIGIRFDQLENTYSTKTQQLLSYLHPAIHEIAHLFVPTHTQQFSRVQTTMTRKLLKSDKFSELEDLFSK